MPQKLTLAFYACERCSKLDQEVRYIWHHRLTVVSTLYVTLQVITVAFFLLYAVQQSMTLRCEVRPNLARRRVPVTKIGLHINRCEERFAFL